jgi:hypothetical protein
MKKTIAYPVSDKNVEFKEELDHFEYKVNGVSVLSSTQSNNATPLGFFGKAYFFVHPIRGDMGKEKRAERSRLLKIADNFEKVFDQR